jgi:hypothetical protein
MRNENLAASPAHGDEAMREAANSDVRAPCARLESIAQPDRNRPIYAGTVTFAGDAGTLMLDNSPSFSGTVAGMTGHDTLD